jgi:hypothetical protein
MHTCVWAWVWTDMLVYMYVWVDVGADRMLMHWIQAG